MGQSLRIERQNNENFRRLVKQLQSSLAVIPFVGAGLSACLGYPQWGEFLRIHAEKLSGEQREKVEGLLAKKEYQAAAAMLEEYYDKEDFQFAIAESFGDDRLKEANFEGVLYSLLPLLTTGVVITTNLDRVLEHAFEAAGRRFEIVINGRKPRRNCTCASAESPCVVENSRRLARPAHTHSQ